VKLIKFMFTIKVVERSSGKPAKSKKVCVGFDGFGRGVTNDEWTDDNGEAHFNYDPDPGEVYVDGRTSYKGNIEGRTVVYI
jgi:hypothetical protein